MDIKDALQTAISYETKLRDLLRQARDTAKSENRFRILKAMAEEEALHVDYFTKQLADYRKTGKPGKHEIKSKFPKKEIIAEEISKLSAMIAPSEYENEAKTLHKAYEFEKMSLAFYREMAQNILTKEEDKKVFEKILEIEESHLHTIEGELNYAISDKSKWLRFE